MTRCAYVEPRLRALMDGELDGGEHRKVLAHLDECAACRDEYARVSTVAALCQEQELDEVPAHFSAALQVRLARHRQERAAEQERRSRSRRWPALPRWQWMGGVATAAATAVICLFAMMPGINAAEVARRAELSWEQIRNYGCVFVSSGVYQGQPRTFTQKQFFRRPGEFRLDTAQDYQLTTFVYQDRIVHYLPGGDWEGQGPLVIVRPRRDGEEALPFPFGVTWNNGGNVSLDRLIRQLSRNRDAELLGTDRVGDRECYRLRFASLPGAGQASDRYELWVDTESFLPRRFNWYRDPQNHIDTVARDLQVNYDVLPAGTFDFRAPDGACVVRGDVDPHVLALPFLPARTPECDTDAVAAAREDAWRRGASVPFPVLAPEWLPEGFKLLRVRRKVGRWVDIHWIRRRADGTYQVIKLIEQDGRENAEGGAGAEVNLGTARRPLPARLASGQQPYPYAALTWTQGQTRCLLFAADLEPAEVKRIAVSFTRVSAPVAPRDVVRGGLPRPGAAAEPSALPEEPEASAAEESAAGPAPESPASAVLEPCPMMPETSD